ncbi:MAG: GNAT family N-acetyltransferase [Proteobacteria bacterium]|nr:GNAT family N-acetyltransferase [Pseudomonadota bacterium]MBS0464501.1 GNAT family N-acetyltransferase [Pseudomonadota bacterium]
MAIIHRATTRDLPALAPLFDAYRQFYEQTSNIAGAHDFLAQRMANDESVLLIAQRDAVAVGFVQLYPTFSSVRMGRVWTLNDLYVAPDARRHGVGRALLDAAVAFAGGDGALGLQLETGGDNRQAQALYRRAGWTQDTNLHFHIDCRGLP